MTSTDPKLLLLGHRGARLSAPENTLSAFDLALAHGCHGFEFDVRRTKDGCAIICHDAKLGRLAVSRSTYGALTARHPSSLKNPQEKFCCLEQVIQRFAGRAFLDIELKVAGMEELVASSVKHLDRERFFVSSFFPRVLKKVRATDPSIKLGWIFDKRWLRNEWKKLDCEYVVPHWKVLNKALLADLRSAGRRVITWTVNQQKDMVRFADMGVDGIISDDTELLCHTLAGRLTR